MNTENRNDHLADASGHAVQVQSPSKRALADVLWEAANVWLKPEPKLSDYGKWSCNAALFAEFGDYTDAPSLRQLRSESRTNAFLAALGCDPDYGSHPGMDSQGTRYMWLLLAMHVAEDEGLTI